MTGLLARLAPAAWLRAPRPTARLRLTLLYGTLFLLSGAALLAVTYLLFEQATAAVTLPDGDKIAFVPRTDLPRPVGRAEAALRRRPRLHRSPR
jgi:hypothetical protein